MFAREDQPEYFDKSRMPIADHLGELATRLRRAFAGVAIVLIAGIALDLTGKTLDRSDIGFALPVLRAITAPAEREVDAYYLRRIEEVEAKLRTDPLASGPREPLSLGLSDEWGERRCVTADVNPGELARLTKLGEIRSGLRRPITTLSAQEAMVTYFKTAFALALVVACPWVFYQFWAFVAAGLYPHEKRYAYSLLPPAVALFLAGVALCQFVVMPSAVRALLEFNAWMGYDPDLRLREWIGFAIVLPLVFGISFQAPLVMVFFTRIGVTTANGYLTYWRHAAFGMAVFAAVITPTQDVVTWGYLFVPLLVLYLLGVATCRLVEPRRPPEAVPDV